MSDPVYLALPPGRLRDACLESFGGDGATAVSLDVLGRDGVVDPGVVLVDPGEVGVDELLAVADRLYEAAPGWRFAAVRDDDPVRVQGLSLGHPAELPELAERLGRDEADPGALLELRLLLREVATARHDINNPLTSALAEAQLLLLDVEEGEVREGLEVIQTQLRRIRDLVADTGHIRPPRR